MQITECIRLELSPEQAEKFSGFASKAGIRILDRITKTNGDCVFFLELSRHQLILGWLGAQIDQKMSNPIFRNEDEVIQAYLNEDEVG